MLSRSPNTFPSDVASMYVQISPSSRTAVRMLAATGVANRRETLARNGGSACQLAMPSMILPVSAIPTPVVAITERDTAAAITLPHPEPANAWVVNTSTAAECAWSWARETTPCKPTCTRVYRTTSKPAAHITALPGLVRRCLTSSLTYIVPSQPAITNAEIRNPPARLPWPPIPVGFSHAQLRWTVPGWFPATKTSPAIARPTRIAYSTTARPICVRAVGRIPTTAMTSMITMTTEVIARFGHGLLVEVPNACSTEGPSGTISATPPMT